jgi:hypothetical protein
MIVEDAPLIDTVVVMIVASGVRIGTVGILKSSSNTCNRTANTEGVLIIVGHLLISVGVTHLNVLKITHALGWYSSSSSSRIL